MSFFKKRSKGPIQKPLFMILYSGPGVGKTGFAASFPSPHFFDFEESTHTLDVSRSRPLTFDEFIEDLQDIYNKEDPDGIKSLVVDTADELERMIHKKVAEYKEKDHIDEIGWQKGFKLAVTYMAEMVHWLRLIRDKHQMHIILLAHETEIMEKDFSSGESYPKQSMAFDKKAKAYLFGQFEMVLYAKKKVLIIKKGEQMIAKDQNERILCTELSAHYDAKNRIGLPPVLPMPYLDGFDVLWTAYLKAFGETPEVIHAECIELTKQVRDQSRVKGIVDYVDKNKLDITIMRAAREKIKSIIEEQESESEKA